jgi:hypothetical protein
LTLSEQSELTLALVSELEVQTLPNEQVAHGDDDSPHADPQKSRTDSLDVPNATPMNRNEHDSYPE